MFALRYIIGDFVENTPAWVSGAKQSREVQIRKLVTPEEKEVIDRKQDQFQADQEKQSDEQKEAEAEMEAKQKLDRTEREEQVYGHNHMSQASLLVETEAEMAAIATADSLESEGDNT